MEEISVFVRPHEWPFRTLIIFVLSILIALWGLIGLDTFGIKIPILRQLIGLMYLLVVPGLLLTKLMRLNSTTLSETVFMSVGLSIAALMVLGFIVNLILPLFGMMKPISTIVIALSTSLLVILLIILTIATTNPHEKFSFSISSIASIRSPQVLGFLLLPLAAVVGTFLMNSYENNIILFFLILTISLIPLLVYFNKISPTNYSAYILAISLSLLLHRSLISQHLWGSDVFEEYYYASQILNTGYWDTHVDWNLNAIVSVTLLPAVFANLCDLNLIWVFKVVYPLIYSLVPLIIFVVLNYQVNERVAFFSAFFYMSVNEFFAVNPVLLRQEIGLLYAALLIYVMFSTKIDRKNVSLLLLIFGSSLIMSHYALTYIMIFCITTTLILTWLSNNVFLHVHKTNTRISDPAYERREDMTSLYQTENIKPLAVLFLLIMAVVWYSYNSSGSGFISIVEILNLILQNLTDDFLNPGATEGLAMLGAKTSSISYLLLKYLLIFSQICISVGLLAVICKKVIGGIFGGGNGKYLQNLLEFKDRFTPGYVCISLIMFSILVAGILVPYFSGNLGSMRLYHISLIILSPYLVLGLTVILQALNKINLLNVRRLSQYCVCIAVFLTIFLLFNTGFVHEVLKDENPNSISLSVDHFYKKSSLYNEMEFLSAKFLLKGENNATVYSDIYGRQILRAYIFPKTRILAIKEGDSSLEEEAYIYLREINCEGYLTVLPIKKLEAVERPYKTLWIDNSMFKREFFKRDKIYTNYYSEVLR